MSAPYSIPSMAKFFNYGADCDVPYGILREYYEYRLRHAWVNAKGVPVDWKAGIRALCRQGQTNHTAGNSETARDGKEHA